MTLAVIHARAMGPTIGLFVEYAELTCLTAASVLTPESPRSAPHLMLELLRQVSAVVHFLARAVAASTWSCSLAET